MNSAEEIAVYKDSESFHSPSLQRRTLGCSYDFPEKSQKKDKKWSLSSIFRRKKKDESDSSSEEDVQKKGFLGRRRKKSDSRKKRAVKPSIPFDHVVIHPGCRNSLSYNGYNYGEDAGVLSDPTAGFSNYIGRTLPQIPPQDSSQKFSLESLNEPNRHPLITGSVDSVRKSRREQTKARAVARRTSSRNNSSSEEESQHSNSSIKIRSEENLKFKEKQISKRSRAARTERYLKRHSRDGENPHNYLRLSKSDVENLVLNCKYSDDSNRSPSRSPLVPKILPTSDNNNKLSFSSLNSQSSNISGLSTIPPSHTNYGKYRVSNSTSNPSYKPPQSMNDYNNSIKKHNADKYFTDHRSVSCDANIHKAPSTEFTQEVLHVQFPVMRPKRGFRNLSLIDASQINSLRQPPPPPPRDPNRTLVPHYFETGRPNTFYFDNSGHSKSKSFNSSYQSEQNPRKFNSFNLNPNYRSTSEDQLARNTINVQVQCRPSSTTPESSRSQRLVARNGETKNNGEEYNYLTDKKPRSRKPIFIKPGTKTADDNKTNKDNTGSQKALHFWKEIDRQNSLTKQPAKNIRSESPQMFTSHTRVQTKVFLPGVIVQNDNSSDNNNKTTNYNPSQFTSPKYEVTEVPLKDDNSTLYAVSKEDIKRKSANLEEALHELEAIYNSLKLGDEDLLERAEQREKESQSKKISEVLANSYPSFTSRGALSDSSFSYEPFDSVDSPRRKRLSKKSSKIDLKLDDMAFRKLNKDRANTISDPQSVVAQVSYLTRSPVFGRSPEQLDQCSNTNNEPDITLDDVVYRNVKHTNNLLKVIEPQPPFGIPLGPITPAANSDYLHAKPENIYKPSFKHKKIPDIVKDDLAFRNLRKDSNKGPALPPFSSEDFSNNNSDGNLSYLKKKRAQRSMSANIGNILYNRSDGIGSLRNNNDVENEFKTLTDIADAMEIARRVLKEKENKISATKKAFMSDTDASYIQSNDSHKESRLNFLNGLRHSTQHPATSAKPSSPRLGDNLSAKPPRGVTPERRRSPKESTPIPISPLEDKRSANDESASSSLEDLLNALAEEAKETTERITKELKKLSEEKENVSNWKEDNLSKRLSDIDTVSEHAKKLLANVVDSTDLITSEKNEEEEVKQIELKQTVPEAATMVMSRFEPKSDEIAKAESEPDYENLTSDNEINLNDVEVSSVFEGRQEMIKSLSPFEEHKAELIASFQELKEKVDEINFPIVRESDTDKDTNKDTSSKMDSIYDNVENDGVTGEDQCAVVALPNKECAFSVDTNPVENRQIYTSSCDITLRKPVHFCVVDDSETSSGFHSNCSCGESSHYFKSDSAFDGFESNTNLESLESLKSPKLVLETSNKVSNKSNNLPKSSKLVMKCIKTDSEDSDDINIPGTSHDVMARNAVDTLDRHFFDDDKKPCPSWYRDPTTMAIACSYGIACIHQLASVDLFAILSILFAVLSFIAGLFL